MADKIGNASIEDICANLSGIESTLRYIYVTEQHAEQGGSTVLRIDRVTGKIWELRSERDKTVEDAWAPNAYSRVWQSVKVREA